MHVDIIVPTYKRASLIPETLAGVLHQTHPHWTCWVTEDGETEETKAAVKPFLKDKRFIYLSGAHSGSPAHPRNRAIKTGTSPLIALLDDDDFWLPEKLEEQVSFFYKNQNCVLLGCNAYRWPGDTPWNSDLPLYFQKKRYFGRIPYSSFVQDNHIILSSAMFRRNVLSLSSLFNENLPSLAVMAEDYEFWLRVGSLGEIWNIDTPLLLYRETPLTYYKELGRKEKYKSREIVLESALKGDAHATSPLSLTEKSAQKQALICEKNFYQKGPRVLGRLRHELFLKLRCLFSTDTI